MKREELTSEEQAKLPRPRQSTFFGFLHHHKSRHADSEESSKPAETRQAPNPSDEADMSEIPFVRLEDTLVYSEELDKDYSKDVYRWAVLYENQRGYTRPLL